MKRIFSIIVPILVLTLSCGPEEPTPVVNSNTLKVTPTSIDFPTPDSAKETLAVESNGNWTVSVANGGSWCKVDSYSGSGNATLTVTATENTTTSPRNTTISFSGQGGTSATVQVSQAAGKENPIKVTTTTLSASPKAWDGVKKADITYQLLAYSFADADGDGWGDLKGVTQHLDYLNELGASAIWLSPIQRASSYHGYDVNNYKEIDPHFGSESDFKDLISQGRGKDIDIYMDYVLNHSGNGTEWFLDMLSNPSESKYRDYYVVSKSPSSDASAGLIDNFAGTSSYGGMGSWNAIAGHQGLLHFRLDWTGSTKTITVTKSDGVPQIPNKSATMWLWIGNDGAVGLYPAEEGIFEITYNVNTSWGFLVKDNENEWGSHKWGAPSGAGNIEFGKPFALVSGDNAGNITFDNGGYSYFASFDQSMPDLNYGPYATAETHPCFKELAASADKWIDMGVKGFRLDAVIWIYQKHTEANVSFLQQWYNRCNVKYKANGGDGNFYMVGEAWEDNAEKAAPYYKGLPSNFNFWYWFTLKERINKSKGNDFASTIMSFRNLFKAQRSDFIDAIKLTNHDEVRAATELGRSIEKEKLAAAVLLTSPGKPYIYQGEELGYWGVKDNGDEFIRTPIKWTRGGPVPTAPLNGKVDNAMLNDNMSIESQKADENSMLNVYRSFARLRNSYVSLASGEIQTHDVYNASNSKFPGIAAWYRVSGSEKTLVVHNFADKATPASFGTEDLSRVIALNGSAELKTTTNAGVLTDNTLNIGPYSSVVFLISE